MTKAENIYERYFASETDPFALNLLCAMAFTRVASHREDHYQHNIPEWATIEIQMAHLANLDSDRVLSVAEKLLALPTDNTYFGWLHTNAIDILKFQPVFSKFAAKMETTSLVQNPIAGKLYDFLNFDLGRLDPNYATSHSELYKLASTADLVGRFINPPAWTAAQALFDKAFDQMANWSVRNYISLYKGTAVEGLYNSLNKIYGRS